MPKITAHSTRDEVLSAVKNKDGRLIIFASKELQEDPEILLASAAKIIQDFSKNPELFNGISIIHAGLNQNNRKLVFNAIEKNALALQNASVELRNDREVVLSAIVKNKLAFEFASERLKKDPFLQRIANLPTEVDKSSLLTLSPLKRKLIEEINPAKKQAAKTMINAIEEYLLLHVEGKISAEEFKISFNETVAKATSILEQQSIWEKLIDSVANAIIACLSIAFKNQTSPEKRFSFFANPNPVAKEIEDVKVAISNKF